MDLFNECIITWISFHGIIDIFLPLHIWIPIYSLVPIFTVYLPQKYIKYFIIPLTIQHFSNDLSFLFPFNYPIISIALFTGLYFRDFLSVQKSLKLFLSIHTAINIHKEIKEFYIYYTLFIMYNIIYCCKPLIYQIDNIIKYPNNIDDFKKRLLIGIILSHTICNL